VLTYILRRLLLMVPTLIGMSLLLFVVVRFAPGISARGMEGKGGGMSGDQDRRAMQEALEKRLRMRDDEGKPISPPMQYLLWLGDTVRGDLGKSIQYNKDVSELIIERLPVTLTLNVISAFLVYLIAIPGGMLAAARRGRWFDSAWSLVTLALYSLPVIWIGSMMLGLLANAQFKDGFDLGFVRINLGLPWFPVAGLHDTRTDRMTSLQYLGDYFWHVTLPIICLTYGGFAYLSKQMRASVLENLALDYARTARAKGLKGSTVLWRHVFRNSLLPLITIASTILPAMLGGSVIVEQIFSIQGMGQLTYTATFGRDLPVIQGVAFVASLLTLISLLIADICYTFADPRVSYE
jgi:ABC-type dipeptide/oligopeptide/nickel transport system permease component